MPRIFTAMVTDFVEIAKLYPALLPELHFDNRTCRGISRKCAPGIDVTMPPSLACGKASLLHRRLVPPRLGPNAPCDPFVGLRILQNVIVQSRNRWSKDRQVSQFEHLGMVSNPVVSFSISIIQ